jgi:hypothetical protein
MYPGLARCFDCQRQCKAGTNAENFRLLARKFSRFIESGTAESLLTQHKVNEGLPLYNLDSTKLFKTASPACKLIDGEGFD